MFSLVLFAFCGTSLHAQVAQVAQVGSDKYATIDEAIANWTNNSTLTLLADVTLSDVVTLKSTEHHILNLGTYTMTAASGKHAIEITCEGRSSASYAITVNADANNPGGITATGKSCIYYKKSGSTKDRPIILINNGVFTGSYSLNLTSNGNTNCPQIWINGGIFNSYMNLTKCMLRVSGGVFHAAINCTGDSSAYREIKGGRFKSWQFMTADAANKFWVGSGNGNYNVGVYVDSEGYLVVGGSVITELSAKYPAVASNYSKWSSYLKYSSAATYGLFYEDADMAIAKHGAANVTVYQSPVQIGSDGYETLAEALTAASAMNGVVTVVINDKVTLNQSLTGSYSSIKFVGPSTAARAATTAEIYLDVQGYIEAAGKDVTFENLTLSKSQGGFINNAGFMNVAFGVYNVNEVTYTNCTFANGAYASSGKVTYTGCTFERSHDKYGLWAYGNVEAIVDGCTFADYRGIKMYAENGANESTVKPKLTVKNTNFEAVQGEGSKPAIVLTYGESVTLENNTYSSTGVFELDLDGAPNGVAVTSDVAPTCVNDNGDCGVLVDGKIYTTVAQAEAVAANDSKVTLLHNSTETVVLPMGVTLDKNGFEAAGVTVAQPVAKIGETKYETLAEAVAAANAGDEIVVIADVADVTVDVTKNLTISGSVTLNNVGINANGADALTVKNLTFTGNSWINSGTAESLTVSGVKATVAPNNTAYTNSRSAFISLGRSEQQTLALTVENCNITVTSSGPDAILGWAAITEATITGNVIKGSSNGYFVNADAIKFMAIADGAEFVVNYNEIYSNYNGIVFAQNTTRDNAYSVSADANKFYGGADHIWIEISGGNTVHATFNATSANTVNGNAFTVADIKYHSSVIKNWTSYAGVDVVTDSNGKVIGGTLASFSNKECIAEGYELNADGGVAKIYVAKIGETKYATLSAAFAAVTDDAQTVVVLRDVTENLTGAYLRGNITTENGAKVTITLTNSDWVYCPYTFVVGENITLNVPSLFYYAGGTQINGTVVAGAYYQRYAGTKLTINEPGSMTVTSETCIIRYMDGDANAGIYVVGDNNDETVGLKLSVAYFYQGMINAKDANIVAGTYWQTNETDAQGSANLVLDNSTLTVTVYDHPAKATGNSTVTLTNGSVIDARNGGFTYDEVNARLSIDATSKIIGKNGVEVKLPVAKINDTKYYTLEAAFKAATSGCTIDIINNVTVDYAWDARYTGAKFTVPVTINGNGNTIKFTASVNDNNYQAPFRFEADATVKGLTIDMSETTDSRFRAISSKGNLTVDGCTFIGKDATLNCRAIIFGEGAGANAGNLAISITDSKFINWKRGITDNENGQDVKTVTITGNNLKNSAVYVSAKETVTFTDNTVEGAYVDIRSYSADNALNVTATDNTLEQNTASAYNYIKAGGTVDAQVEFKLAPVAKIGNVEYTTLAEAFEAAVEGDVVRLLINTTLAEELTTPAGITIDGNGKQINGTIYAGGNLTFVGHTKVTAFSASYYNRVITIGEGACLEITGGGRVSLAYGNIFNITGSIENAKTADKANVQASLIIPAGISITGGSDAAMNVTNAYVQIGSTTSKNSAANGTFTMNFTNSIVEFTKEFALAEPTSGKNPTFNMNIEDCVLTTGTKFIAAAPNSNVVVDNSVVTLGTYFRNSGKFDIVNGSEFTGATIQFGENGGNNGALTVDASELTINASSIAHALDGKATGSITLKNGAKATIDYIKDMAELYMTADSKLYSKTADLNIQTEPSYKVVYNENDKVYETADATIYVATKAELKSAIENAVDGTFIRMSANIDYGTDQLAITKNINLNLGGFTLTTANAYGGMSVKGNPTIKNGTIVHASNTAAIKVWNATAFEDLVIDVQGKGDANKTIGGIVLQSGSTTRVGSIKNVTIKGAALTNGIETYNCGDAEENVIGSMENVTINAQGTGMLISAPCGTATNCSIKGGVNGIEIWIKGNYSASLDLVNSKVEGGVYAHDEFNSNPGIVNNGTLSLTADENTTGAGLEDVTLTIARAENLDGVVEDVMEAAKAKIGNTYYITLAKAIAAAKAGDVVTVFEGTYAMPSMKAGITIVGEGNVLFEGTLTNTLENLTMKNIYIKGGNAQRWAYAKGNLVFENVTFEATSVYALHFDGITEGATLTYKDCTIIGWAAMSGSPASCTFDGCTFKGNGTYGLIRTYFDATIENCTFDVANVNTTDIYQDGIHAVDGATVTVNNCTNVNGNMKNVVNVGDTSVVVLNGVKIQNVAKIGDNYYLTLQGAFAAVGNGAGKTVELLCDVDLDGQEWTPIGTSANPFNGTFDGQGHTISNLVINGGSNSNLVINGGSNSNQGFFGTTQNGEIKNVTFNNAKVTGRLNVGVVAGTPYTSKYTNVKVTGHVEVNGMAYVGGVGGKNAYANWTDITVDVDEDSYVNANSVENGTAYRTYVGGVIGFNGEGGHTFKNISSNIKVIGSTCDIGGVFGIAHYNNKFENITFTGAVEAPEGAEEVGGIAGVWHNEEGTSVTFTDCTSTGTVKVGEVETTGSIVGGAYNAANETEENSGSLIIDGVEAWLKVAQVGEVKYLTLAEAVAAVTENTTITMLADVELTSTVTVAKDQVVTLDLNGKTISAAITEQLTKSFAAIQNKGTLTVKDSATTRATGKITVSYAGASFGYGVGLYTISNEGGTLNIESGIVENTTTVSGSMYDAIDNNSTTGNTVLNILGGEVKCQYIGVRQFANSTTYENIVNVTAGRVEGGNTSIWMQNPGSNQPKATIAISDDAYITGRLLAGESTGFVFNVKGGTFTTDVTAFCADNFSAVQTGPNAWVVKQTAGELTRTLPQGWSWFSSYVNISGAEGLTTLEDALGGKGVQIKDEAGKQFAQYSTTSGWYGNLTEASSTKMYSIRTSAAVEVSLEGEFFGVENYEPVLRTGWNYISYPHHEPIDLATALRGFTPVEGDVIKSKKISAIYTSEGWFNAFELNPGEGFMYRSNAANKQVAYTTEDVRSTSRSFVSEAPEHWTADATQYPGNMTMIATLDVEGADYEVAAFVDGEVRGSARPIYVDFLDQYIVVMTINGEDVANVTFKYYDLNAAEVYDLNNVVVYSDNAILGSIESPYALTRGTTGIDESSINSINIYPNPTTTDREINLQATCDKVEVFNTLGVKVAEYQNVDSIDALETAGTYVIRVTLNGDVKHCRLIVK